MNISESLSTLNVSEDCYNEIMKLVEEYINEISKESVAKIEDTLDRECIKDSNKFLNAKNKAFYNPNEQTEKEFKEVEKEYSTKNKKRDKFKLTAKKWGEAKRKGKIKPYEKED